MNSPRKKVQTTRELAELAGVSHMTVSRVFKNPDKVKAETREHILALAEEYQFRPNPVLSMAMAIRNRQKKEGQGFTSTIGWVHSNSREDTWHTQPHLVSYLQGVRERAATLGFGVDEFWTGEGGLSHKRFCDILSARGIVGCIIAPPRGKLQRMRLRWKEASWVTFEHDAWRPLLNRVGKDDNYMIGKALRELRRLGKGKIAFALPETIDEKSGFVLQGRFRVAQKRHPSMGSIPPFLFEGADIPDVGGKLLTWLKRNQPDVLICMDVRTRRVLEEGGIRVPQDMGLVHLNLGLDTPDWTGMYLDGAQVGAACVDLLVSQLQQNQRGIPSQPYELLLRPQWRRGTTV